MLLMLRLEMRCMQAFFCVIGVNSDSCELLIKSDYKHRHAHITVTHTHTLTLTD